MKKLIAILTIAIVLVGAVFAADNDKVTLESTVGRIKPGFVIFSGETAVNTSVDTQKDLSEESITWEFQLKQSGNEKSKTYSRYKGAITLTVTINPFAAEGVGTQGTAYEIQAVGENSTRKGTEVQNKLTLGTPSVAENKHSVTFGLTYAGKKVTDTEAADLGTVKVIWTQDPDLPMEDTGTKYTTDIVLTYTVS